MFVNPVESIFGGGGRVLPPQKIVRIVVELFVVKFMT
jgi:hypothetical protein